MKGSNISPYKIDGNARENHLGIGTSLLLGFRANNFFLEVMEEAFPNP